MEKRKTIKTKMMKTIYISLLIFSILLYTGCSEDFLDLKPIAEETEVSYYTTFEALDRTATAAYGILCSRDIFDFYYFMGYASIADDSEVGGEGTHDWPEFQSMDRLLHHPNLDYVFDSWGYCYKGIRMTNEYLSRVDMIKELDPLNYDEDFINRRIAEMKFLRAFYYFYLLQVYGGVPVVDKLLTPDDDLPRNSIAEVLHFIENDCREAIPYLNERSVNLTAGEVGRASRGAARALLAKAYLYESSYAHNYVDDNRFDECEIRWDSAFHYADAVIQSGEYKLVGIGGERFHSWRDEINGVGGYRWIFTVDGDNSEEGVWEIQRVNDGLGWIRTRGTYMVVYTTIRFYDNGSGGTLTLGWSFNLPTQYLLNAFGNQDRRETGLHSAEMNPLLDPRFSTTVGTTDTIIINGVAYPKDWDQVCVNAGGSDAWRDMNFSNLATNTISRKYEASPSEFWRNRVDWGDGPMNGRFIRYADIMLMAAEAAYMLDKTDIALDYVNQVRTRARNSGDTGYPENLTTISFEDIVHERRLELAMEGARGFDLIRWRLAETYIDGIQLAAWPTETGIDFVPGKHEFFPIPSSEIQLSSALEQYPGWR